MAELTEEDVNWSVRKKIDSSAAAAALREQAGKIYQFVRSTQVRRNAGTGSHWYEIENFTNAAQPEAARLVADTFLDSNAVKWLVQQRDHIPDPEHYLRYLEDMAVRLTTLASRLASTDRTNEQKVVGRSGAQDALEYDVFISHASQDKDAVARPIAEELAKRKYRVWFDEFVLRVGSSLTGEINKGLARSRHGIVILSPAFFERQWADYELKGLVQREFSTGRECILPVWHNIDAPSIVKHAPTLADKFATNTARGISVVVEQLCLALGAPVFVQQPASDSGSVSSPGDDGRCPNCGSTGEIYGYEGSDGDEFAWFECHTCGHFAPLSE